MDRMRIACPTCAAEYDVPERLLAGPARKLRCSRCATEFALPAEETAVAVPAPAAVPEPAVPVAPEPPPEAPPEVAAPAMTAPPEARAPVAAVPEASAALRRAWAASVAAVVLGAGALVVFRGAIMAAWPPAARLFVAIGLA